MFILDVPPNPPSETPVLMVQAGADAKGNVLMQDLTSHTTVEVSVLAAQAGYGVGKNVVMQDLTPTRSDPLTTRIPDTPNVPPQDAPVMIAQANQAQTGDVTKVRTLGVCTAMPNRIYSLSNVIEPVASANFYLEQYEHRKVDYNHLSGVVAILQQPKHGILRPVTQADVGTILQSGGDPVDPAAGEYFYLPETGYEGKDSAILLVETGGVKVKVKYYFHAINGDLDNEGSAPYCAPQSTFWKISSTLDTNGNNTITSVEYQSPVIDASATVADTATLGTILNTSIQRSLNVDGSAVTVTFGSLAGGAVGQTTGEGANAGITLDTNAAGHGWFIDTTPADNSEFLPTSNPDEWVAKAGSDAYGKMDMLSVLLHEYGHALGINHSADPNDYMGATLTPGVRRMSSADELALMQQLIGQAKATLTPTLSQGERGQNDAPTFPTLPLGGLGFAFAGLLRSNRYGGTSIDLMPTQYAVAANASFANLNSANGWNTQGSVDFAPLTGSGRTAFATLNEVPASQTRLSQVFMLSDKDRYLSFTLSGAVLDNPTGAPDDTFEAALPDSNLATIGLIATNHQLTTKRTA